jgi:membrane dipeptidase
VRFLRPDGRLDTAGTGLDAVVRHVEYLAERLGGDGVGFGSDFDGARVPDALGDVRGVRRLAVALEARGFAGAVLEGVCSRNWLRVLRRAWKEPATP